MSRKRPILPNPTAKVTDDSGSMTREYRNFLLDVENSFQDQIAGLASALAAVGILTTTVAAIPAKPGYVAGINSLTGDTVSQQMALVNDSAAPGNNKVYGTDAGGVLGYRAPLLPNGVSAGLYGDATHVPQITIAPDGTITLAASVLISAATVPVKLAAGTPFTVPVDTQALFSIPIQLMPGAVMTVAGYLVEVH